MLGIRSEKLTGMAAMLVGVASFSFMDAGLKLLAAHYSATQVASLRGLAALPVVFAWSLYSGGLRQLVQVRWPLHLLRGVLSVVMMITFTFALKSLSLAKTYSIFFVAPLLIALLSVVLLGERVRRVQWAAIAVGFAGVLIVLKPETTGFGWWGTLAVLGTAVAYAISSVLVKILGRTDSTQAMMFWMTGMLAIGATALALPGWQAIAIEHYPILAGIALTGAIGQWGITVAFKNAPAASVAPLEYTGLAWVILIDFAVWSAVPGLRTLMGAALIIASGIYLLRFEARRVPGPA
ncbi:MAG TPA: DMT family transporter [Steroidobacteraceae bacterium]|jgi:drug/metabolite transporter (DMT)-like permease|nr:DMT family transporter [Steroidobacteraceae bacterium]